MPQTDPIVRQLNNLSVDVSLSGVAQGSQFLRGPGQWNSFTAKSLSTFYVEQFRSPGFTDDQTVAAALAAVTAAGGGRMVFGCQTYTLDDPIVFATGATGVPLFWVGSGDHANDVGDPNGGTILDLRYAGPGPKIACWRPGFLGLQSLHLIDGGTSSNVYVQTSATTLDIEGCSFFGNPSKTLAACDQDMIVVGSLTSTIANVALTANVATITTAAAHGLYAGEPVTVAAATHTEFNGTFSVATVPTSTTFTYALTHADVPSAADTGTCYDGFQGYGTIVQNCLFRRVRAAVRFQTFCNSITVANNQIWNDCGSADSSHAALMFNSGSAGNYVANNLFEMAGYPVGILVADSSQNVFAFNPFWDCDAVTCIKVTGTSDYNQVYAGNVNGTGNTSHVVDTSSAARTNVYSSNPVDAACRLSTPIVLNAGARISGVGGTATAAQINVSGTGTATDLAVTWTYPASQSSLKQTLVQGTHTYYWDGNAIGCLSGNDDFTVSTPGTGGVLFNPGNTQYLLLRAGAGVQFCDQRPTVGSTVVNIVAGAAQVGNNGTAILSVILNDNATKIFRLLDGGQIDSIGNIIQNAGSVLRNLGTMYVDTSSGPMNFRPDLVQSMQLTSSVLTLSVPLVLPAVADASIPNGGIAWSTGTPNALKVRDPAGNLKTVTLA